MLEIVSQSARYCHHRLELCRTSLHIEIDDGGVVGPHTFAPIVATSKGKAAVSHSPAEAGIIAMEYALWAEGLPYCTFKMLCCRYAPLVGGLRINGRQVAPELLGVPQKAPARAVSTITRATAIM